MLLFVINLYMSVDLTLADVENSNLKVNATRK